MIAALSKTDEATLRKDLLETVSRNLALEILKRQLDDEVNPEALHSCPVCQALMNNVFSGGNSHYRMHIDFKRPVIGIGAPIAFFLPRAAAMIGARAVLPEHADVANAIGAITSNVVIERQVRIIPGGSGEFLIEGLAGFRRFKEFEAADAFAKDELVGLVRTLAREAGTSTRSVYGRNRRSASGGCRRPSDLYRSAPQGTAHRPARPTGLRYAGGHRRLTLLIPDGHDAGQ